MLIKSHAPKKGAVTHSPSKGEAVAKKPAQEPVEDLYSQGHWNFEYYRGETYGLDRRGAVEFMKDRGYAEATYVISGARGDYNSLSEIDKQKRRTIAKREAIGKGIGFGIVTGTAIAGGSALLGILGDIGSLLTRTGGAGAGVGASLGAVGAIAGVAGLAAGLVLYKDALQFPVSELVQRGEVYGEKNGFRFEPSEVSPDSRPILVTKDSVTVAPKRDIQD